MINTYDGLNRELTKLLKGGVKPTFEYYHEPRKVYSAEDTIHQLAHCMANRCNNLAEEGFFCKEHNHKVGKNYE